MGALRRSGWRLRIVVFVALMAMGVGVTAAYSALGTHDTATGLSALASEAGGDFNTADGYSALQLNSTGSYNTAAGENALAYNDSGDHNTALGSGAGWVGFSNTSGSDNTFLGYQASVGVNAQLNDATAVGANSVVSQSDSLVLGASGVNVGINTATPQSRLQIGSGATSSWGDYLQLPVVNSTDKAPPAADCNTSTFVGRIVIQAKSAKKLTLWACSAAGVWVKA